MKKLFMNLVADFFTFCVYEKGSPDEDISIVTLSIK